MVPSYSLHFGMFTSQAIRIPTTTTIVEGALDQHHLDFGIVDTVIVATHMYASILEVNLSLSHFFHFIDVQKILK